MRMVIAFAFLAMAIGGCTQVYQYGNGDSVTLMQMGMGTVPVQVGPGGLP